MALKRTFLNLDYRQLMLPAVFTPLILWVAAVAIAIVFWRERGSFSFACVLFVVGGVVARFLPDLEYWMAARALPVPLPGTAGKDYLIFSAEDPATVHQFKVLAEDGGFIFAEGSGYRILTLHHDYRVPFDNFHQELIQHKGKTKAILIRFRPADSDQTVELAISCTYAGKDLEIAGNIPRKNEWAAGVIAAMNRRKPPPLAAQPMVGGPAKG